MLSEKCSLWQKVNNKVSQGSVLVPIMFAITINDMDEEADSYVCVFAEDVEPLRRVRWMNEKYCYKIYIRFGNEV